MNLYKAAKFRFSNRKYLKEPLDENMLEEIKQHIDGMFPLYDDVRYSIDIIDMSKRGGYVSNWLTVKAPYYVCINSTCDDKAYINAGYMLENLAVYLTSKGIASSFVSSLRVKLMEKDGLRPVILLAFGKPKDMAYRECRYAKRIDLYKLVMGVEDASDIMMDMINIARLAPSASNTQPWRFQISNNCIHIFSVSSVVTTNKSDMIGIGNALANMHIVSEERWQECHIERRDIASEKKQSGKYICTLVLVAGKNTY